MPRLSHVIAIEGDHKKQVSEAGVEAHRLLQKEPLLNGISRTYQRDKDDGEEQPPETTLVQIRVGEVTKAFQAEVAKLLDITATKDWGNRNAKASVQIDGQTLLTEAPVVFLVWLEGELAEVEKFVKLLPTLDQAQHWDFDDEAGVWKTAEVQTTRNKKQPRTHVKYDSTKEHPAQTEVWWEDLRVGVWTTVKTSGAIPVTQQREILDRLRRFREAVKVAREEANTISVAEQKVGEGILKYIFG